MKLHPALVDRFFSRGLIVAVFWMAWRFSEWSWAFAGTAIAQEKPDLTGAAAVIGAVGVLPLGLVTLAVNKYMEMRRSNADP